MSLSLRLCDFILEVKESRDIVVLQLSDPQIIDAMQKRSVDRLTPKEEEYWATDKIEERCYGYIREVVFRVKPDFIFIAGDLVYGQFDDKGTSLRAFVNFMESFCIPWAPIWGNHDNESVKGVAWQCEQLEKAEYCLFKKGDVTGNGNYTVGIVQGNELKRVFVMLDTHGCLCSPGLKQDQIEWFTTNMNKIHSITKNVKFSMVMHIQPDIFKDAYSQYGFTNENTKNNPIDIDNHINKRETDFGYIGGDLKTVWNSSLINWLDLKQLGLDSIFVGHEHANSASVVYQGIRFQFGQKSSAYDRCNYITSEGKIVTSYLEVGEPVVGGTVFSIKEKTGEIVNAYVDLCKK